MSYNEIYAMFETCHTKDADFNAQKLAKLWEAITMDTEVNLDSRCRLVIFCSFVDVQTSSFVDVQAS